jgi:hypothetical protein
VGTSVRQQDGSSRPYEIEVGKNSIEAFRAKMNAVKQPRSMPVVLPEKALVVVLAPTPSARASGKGKQIKLHANDRVAAVSKQGTWSFAYLDPREYSLVSQAANANGLRMALEAGHEYYFLQNALFGGFKGASTLTQHSKEFVLFKASGAYYSEGRVKAVARPSRWVSKSQITFPLVVE